MNATAMPLLDSIHPENQPSFFSTKDMIDELVKRLNRKLDSEFRKIRNKKNYPEIIIVQHVSVKEEVEKQELHRLKNATIIDTLTSVDIQETAWIGGVVIEIYEGVFLKKELYISNFQETCQNFVSIEKLI